MVYKLSGLLGARASLLRGLRSIALFFGTVIGMLRFANRIPLAATCSGAFSAACHALDASFGHHTKEVH